MRILKLFTDENGKLSSTRLAGLLFVCVQAYVVIHDVHLQVDPFEIVYDALVTLILGLFGVTGLRAGAKILAGQGGGSERDA